MYINIIYNIIYINPLFLLTFYKRREHLEYLCVLYDCWYIIIYTRKQQTRVPTTDRSDERFMGRK